MEPAMADAQLVNGYPLTEGQKSLLFINQFDPRSSAYNEGFALRIGTTVSLEAISAAVRTLVNRHPALRTLFTVEKGEWTQKIGEALTDSFQVVNAQDWSEETVYCALADAYNKPYNLATEPVFRAICYKRTTEHVILIGYHHIIGDGWSTRLFLDELLALLTHTEAAEPSSASFSDFVQEQTAYLPTERGQQAQAYWRTQLTPELPILDMPYDRPFSEETPGRAATRERILSDHLHQQLGRFCQAQGLSKFAVLLATYQVLLHEYAGQDEVVVGFPAANRSQRRFSRVFGYLANPLLIRSTLTPGVSVDAYLKQQQQQLTQALIHQAYPLTALSAQGGGLYQTFFSYLKSDPTSVAEQLLLEGSKRQCIGSLSLETIPLQKKEVQFPLALACVETAGQTIARLTYDAERYDAATIQQFLITYEQILGQFMQTPGATPIAALDLLSMESRAAVLGMGTGPVRDYPLDKTFIDLFTEQALRTPTAVAVTCEGQSLTYAELNHRSDQLAACLRGRTGVDTGQRVGLLLDRSEQLLVGIIGILKAGATYMPIDPDLPAQRLAWLCEQAAYVVTDGGEYAIPAATKVIDLSREENGLALEAPALVVNPDAVAYLMYTSGSTGVPKGVMVQHKGMLNHLFSRVETFSLNRHSRVVQCASHSFDISVWQSLAVLLVGGTTLIYPRSVVLSPALFLERLGADRASVLQVVPTYLVELLNTLERTHEQMDFSALTYVATIGEELKYSVAERWRHRMPKVQFMNTYGPTEAADTVAQAFVQELPESGRIPIGRPIANTHLYVLTTERQLCPVGAKGEIYIAGAGVGLGYRQAPEQTAAVFVANPFSEKYPVMYRTGDLGRWLPDGSLEFHGRVDNQVKIRGHRVELGEVEQVLQSLAGVSLAAVVIQSNGQGEKIICAFVVALPDSRLSEESLKHQLGQLLPAYMVPAFIELMPAMPLTTSGKVNRKALPRPTRLDQSAPLKRSIPGNECEIQLLAIWQDVLGVRELSLEDDFFALGGHSIKALAIVARVRETFGVQAELNDIYKYPTIEQLAHWLQADQLAPVVALEPTPRTGRYPVTDAQRKLWIACQSETNGQLYNMPGFYRLEGTIQVGAFAEACRQLVSRHESLRTVFFFEENQLWQSVQPVPENPVLEVFTDCLWSEEPIERHLINHTFDLQAGPLYKICLWPVHDQMSYLGINLHHTIADGTTLAVLWDELTQLYNALTTGTPLTLAPLAVQYPDVAVWLQNENNQARQADNQQYWLTRFADEVPVLNFANSHTRTTQSEHRGQRVDLTFSEALSEKIYQTAAAKGVSVFTLLGAALNALLYKYTGQTDLVIGTPISTRTQVELLHQVGLYQNVVPLRTTFDETGSVDDLLACFGETLREAVEHQQFSYEALLNALRQQGQLTASELFRVIVSYEAGVPQSLPTLHGLRVIAHQPTQAISAKYDLDFLFTDHQKTIQYTCIFDTALFEEWFIRQLSRHLVRLVEAITSSDEPTARLANLTVLSAEETAFLSQTLNETTKPYDLSHGYVAHFDKQVRLTPDAIAVRCEDRTLTYQELDEASSLLAAQLGDAVTIHPGEVIGVLTSRSEKLIISWLAVLKAGGAFLLLSPTLPDDRLQFMIQDSTCRAVVTEETFVERLHTPVPVLAIETLAQPSSIKLKRNHDTQQAAYVMYTSGSTGQPKAVCVSMINLMNYLFNLNLDTLSGRRFPAGMLSSVSFDGSLITMLSSLLRGDEINVYPDQLTVDNMLATAFAPDSPVRFTFLTPAHVALLQHLSLDFSRMAFVTVGGELLKAEHVDILRKLNPDIEIVNIYGPTETTISCSIEPISGPQPPRIPIGKPDHNCRFYVLDKNRNMVPVGVSGELYVGGLGVAQGYLNRPELTAERFVRIPQLEAGVLYKTGDLVKWLPDGKVHYLGRNDAQIKLNGQRLEPAEIEHQLTRIELIHQAYVTTWQQGTRPALVAYVQTDQPGRWAVNDLKAQLRQSLPAYMIPASIIFLESLPLTANGKVDKRRLPEPQLTDEVEYPTRQHEGVEKLLLDACSQVLGHAVQLADDFFLSGGDSISAIQIISKLKAQGYSLTVRDMFEAGTLSLMIPYIQRSTEAAPLLPAIGEVPLSPIQRQFFTYAVNNPSHFCQTVMLGHETQLDKSRIEASLKALQQHHDALRMTYRQQPDGHWDQVCQPDAQPVVVMEYLMQDQADPWPAIDQLINQSVSTFKLTEGPLMKAMLFRLATGDYLFWAIHHLVVDGVSWRILMEDFTNLYNNLNGVLPNKTVSYRQWVRGLAQYEKSPAFGQATHFWNDFAARYALAQPLLTSHQTGWYQTARHLDARATQRLLTEAKGHFQADMDSLLLMALQQGLPTDGPFQTRLADIERHGRETLVDGNDHARTVGWFTHFYPVRLPVQDAATLAERVTAVAESLADSARHGIAYLLLKNAVNLDESSKLIRDLQAPVLFNYLGQLDHGQAEWVPLEAYTQTYQHGPDSFPYALMVNCAVLNGQLRLQVMANQDVLSPDSADAIADGMAQALNHLIEVLPNEEATAQLSRETTQDQPVAGRALSPAQRRMWFIDQYEKQISAYNLPHAVVLRGDLQRAIFEQALTMLMFRHDALRTTIEVQNQVPAQVVAPAAVFSLPFSYTDVRHTDNPWQAAQQLAETEGDRSFNLATDSLFQASLIQFAEQEYLFVTVLHHIIADGWSLQILYQELMATYNALLAGRVPFLPPLATQYHHFADWQNNYLQTETCAADRAYWHQQLQGELTPLQLPTDWPRPRHKTYNSRNVDWVMSDQVSQQVRQFRQQTKSSLFSTAFAAISVLLHRYANQDDLVIGTPISYRERPDLQNQVGLYLNTLPIRLSTTGADSFLALHQQVRDRLLGAYQHQFYPLEQIVDDSKVGRDMSRSPLFDVLIASEDFRLVNETGDLAFTGMTAEPYTLGFSANKFDVSFYVKETNGRLTVSIGYNTDLFREERIRRMAQHLETLLGQLVSQPETPIAGLGYITADEYQRLVSDFNQTITPYPTQQTLHGLVEESVEKNADRVALRLHDKILTYRELNEQANQLAHHLLAGGLRNGANVGLIAHRDFGMIVGMLGILKAGGAYVPIDPGYPTDRQAYILQNSSIDTLVTDDQAVADALNMALQVVALTPATYANAPRTNPRVDKSAQDLAYVIYTSGSSGRPKGVMIEHHSAVNLVQWVNQRFAVNAQDRLLFVTSMCFDLSVYDVFGLLAAGGELVITQPAVMQDPRLLADYMQQTGITFWDSVPTTFNQLLTYLENNQAAYRQTNLRTVFLSGDWIPVSIPGRMPAFFPNASLISLGGATEGTVWSNYYPVERPDPNWVSIPYGKPLSNNFFYILDQYLNPVPEGVVGDLYIGGVGVAAGYINDEAKTKAAFMADPFSQQLGGRMYRTGDIGRMLPDGNMEFLGRKDQQVKIKGYRIEIGEIETILQLHEQVREAVILAKTDPNGQKQLVAFVALREPVDAGQLTNFLRQTLPEYMIPAQYVELDELPLNTNGKIDRKALAERSVEQVLSNTAYVAPQNTTQQQVADLLKAVIGVQQVGLHDNLFTLGLDSLKTVQVFDRIQAVFAKTIEIRDIFSSPTVAELAQLIDGLQPTEQSEDVLIDF